MPTAALYFIPPHATNASSPSPSHPTLPVILALLQKSYNPSPLPSQQWNLHHRLYRSTSSRPHEQGNTLQVLALPHISSATHVTITSPPTAEQQDEPVEPATVSLPPGRATDDFLSLMRTKLSPLWSAVKGDVGVSNGQAYEVGNGGFGVRVGELRAAGVGRGVVLEVEWKGGEDEEVVRGFWQGLDVKTEVEGSGKGRKIGKDDGVGEVIVMSKDGVDGEDEWEEKKVTAWMEMLRTR